MRTAPAPPFIVAPPETIQAGEWQDPTGQVLPDQLVDWDPHTDLVLSRELVLDLQHLREATHIGPRATLAVAASWISSTTRLSGSGPVVELGDLDRQVRVETELRIEGLRAGGRLSLRTVLALRDGDPAAAAVAARFPGSVLWSDTRSVLVEGSAARFPVTAARFSDLIGAAPDAGWFLEWDPDDLDQPASGALRLLLNAERADIVDAVRTGASTPEARAVQSFVRYDVARALVHGALLNDRFVENTGHWEEESLGRLLANLLQLIWPDVPAHALRTRLETTPGRIDMEIQSSFPVSSG